MLDETDVILVGLKDTKRALKDFAPEVLKAMNKEIRGIGNNLAGFARSKIPDSPPMSGWRANAPTTGKTRGGAGWPGWNSSEITKGIKFKQGGTKKKGSATQSAYSLVNESAAGAIFEIAGRRSSGSGSGAAMLVALSRFGKASRAVWAALDERGKREIQEGIATAIADAENKLQELLDSANDRENVR